MDLNEDIRDYELGYVPGDPEDRFLYIYDEVDETRRTVRKIGQGLEFGFALAYAENSLWRFSLGEGEIGESLDFIKIDPITGALVDEKELKKDKKAPINITDIEEGETFTTPDAEEDNEVSGLTAFTAGVASGLIKVPEGIVSLGAELIDLGAGTNLAADVEQFFDKINPFEEIAEERAIGRLTEAFVQIGVPGGLGAKLATKLATKAIRAKKQLQLLLHLQKYPQQRFLNVYSYGTWVNLILFHPLQQKHPFQLKRIILLLKYQ